MNATATSAAFERFKERFDTYMARAEVKPEEMIFLRYEGSNHLPGYHEKLHEPEVLDEYLAVLTACQDYAVDGGVTSTYVFFNPLKYQQWCEETGKEDTVESRAAWAQTRIKETVDPLLDEPMICFMITALPKWSAGL